MQTLKDSEKDACVCMSGFEEAGETLNWKINCGLILDVKRLLRDPSYKRVRVLYDSKKKNVV